MTKEILETVEEPKTTKELKKTKKFKRSEQELDDILFSETKEENIDFGDVPEFMSLDSKPKKQITENIPDFLRY